MFSSLSICARVCDAESDAKQKAKCIVIGIVYYEAVRKYGASS